MDSAHTLILLGGLFLLGLVTDVLGRRTFLPRAALLLLLGFAFGPSGLGWIDGHANGWFPFVAHVALVMIGFLLGGELTADSMRSHGRSILIVSLGKVIGSFGFVLAGGLAVGIGLEAALLLAAISTATAPAATLDVLHSDHATGPFSRTVRGVVAVDDAWALIAFSVALAAVEAASGLGNGGALQFVAHDVGGALLLGLLLGVPAALLTGRIEPGEPMQAEALALVFLCAGLAQWLQVSFVLAAMAMGATVSNLARHHRRPFSEIEGIEWPFLILFFALAGAMLDFGALGTAAGLVLVYVTLRGVGTTVGCWVGVEVSRDPELMGRPGRWLGVALMPQAGVALGMALVASQRLPGATESVLPVVIASTAILELFGPILTRVALRRVAEGQDESESDARAVAKRG